MKQILERRIVNKETNKNHFRSWSYHGRKKAAVTDSSRLGMERDKMLDWVVMVDRSKEWALELRVEK